MVIDDHPIIHRALETLVETEASLVLDCTATSAAAALKLLRTSTPDLVILLTMSPEVSLVRIQDMRGEELNDFEQEEQLRKVADLFASFEDPCIMRISADAPLETVSQEIRKSVDVLMQNNMYLCNQK